ncbi:hypothetical protein BRC83_06440 [Halobacteriales archaeon QS_1_68_17]|nr:MAG: hypothetical protein BRC83_06440 [Halobacteriales archaeon QS_1_68_17]
MVEEVYRFDNGPLERDERYVWDVDGILGEIREGLGLADERGELESVAVDTTGLDFGFYADGGLIRDPTFYRDPVVMSTVDQLIEEAGGRRRIFGATGINH